MKDREVGLDDCDEKRVNLLFNTFPTVHIYNLERQHSVPIKISTSPQILPISVVNEMKFLKIDAP